LDAFQLILFPTLIIALMGVVFGASVLTTAIDDHVGIITCPFPNYATGINQTSFPCSIVSKPETYTDDSFLGIPIGYVNFLADSISSLLYRAVSVFALIGLIAFPIVALALLVPATLASLLFGILAPFTALLYTMLGLGIYKAVSPFTSA